MRAMMIELDSRDTVILQLIKRTHEEFGVAIVPPEAMQFDNLVNVDVEALKFKWVPCSKDSTVGDCWRQHFQT